MSADGTITTPTQRQYRVLALLGAAQATVAAAARILGDRVSRRGNQLFRLGQRLRNADERLVAAMAIVMET